MIQNALIGTRNLRRMTYLSKRVHSVHFQIVESGVCVIHVKPPTIFFRNITRYVQVKSKHDFCSVC